MHYTFQAIYSSHLAFTTIFSNAIRYKVAEASRRSFSLLRFQRNRPTSFIFNYFILIDLREIYTSQTLLLLSNQKTGIPSALLKSIS
ncbi:hypothetical protein M422DRAFT_39591 [Sphaerobolus stellatus SS14]|uniref:Uncharacterized protein n=1 Tax=Sphaerobolus stellatus (strain SS14) TaxID=990650 RepID=A0A0C9U343_SPHS4|nr:hypothetical protein M422DRAFT_39591 [Sphaerobolus stellatus SS14]